MVYVIQVCWQLASWIRTEPVLSWSCLQAVRRIPLLCVQWKTPDDGQRNCPKHVEFYSKNKFEKLVHLVGFIVRIVHPCLPGCCWLREEAEVDISCDGYHTVRGRECNYSVINGNVDCRNTERYGKWQKCDPGRRKVCTVFWRHGVIAGTSEWPLRRWHSCGMPCYLLCLRSRPQLDMPCYLLCLRSWPQLDMPCYLLCLRSWPQLDMPCYLLCLLSRPQLDKLLTVCHEIFFF